MEPAEASTFRESLTAMGLKFTRERRLILDEVFRNHGHFEADDIVFGLRHRGHRVSRASVYRALPLLVRSGLLREVHSSEKHSHYEHVFGHGHHDHLICTECGRTIEFYSPAIERLQAEICNEHGFLAAGHSLEITGVCDACSRAGKARDGAGARVSSNGSSNREIARPSGRSGGGAR